MNTTNQILDQVTALLIRVRARTIGFGETEHVLEAIAFNLRQLATRPGSCCGTLEQLAPKLASNIRVGMYQRAKQ